MKNRTSTLLFADVAGYTRLIERNETQATIDIKYVFEKFVWSKLPKIQGRIVQIEGDGFFLEIPSPLHAVNLAKQLQQDMLEYNKEREELDLIEFRIGIHYGDVLVDEQTDRLSGTAVNIAARLENIAETGGIWVSETIAQELNKSSDFEFFPLGSRRLKNIPGRVPIFGVLWNENDHVDQYAGYNRDQFETVVPSVAILPFNVVSEKPESRYLSDAIVEDLMTELGRFTEVNIVLFDDSCDGEVKRDTLREIGRKLGVDYIIQGSIIRHSDNIRVHARLFETDKGEQIWANKFDSNISNMFELHDAVARDLSSKLPLRIERSVLSLAKKKPLESLDAYDCYLRGRSLYREKTEEKDFEAIEYLERAIKLDPSLADAHSVLGAIHGINWAYAKWGLDPTNDIIKGRQLIKKALSLNHDLPRAHAHLAWTYLSTSEFDEATACFNEALKLNPNDTDILLLRAYAIMYMGEPKESIRICEELMKLNPQHPDWYLDVLGGSYFIAGNYEKGLQYLSQVSDLFPECYGWIAASQAYLGFEDDSRKSALKFISRISKIWKGSENASIREHIEWFLTFACPFMLEQDRINMAIGLFKSGLDIPERYLEHLPKIDTAHNPLHPSVQQDTDKIH